jgi:hypothetical protein
MTPSEAALFAVLFSVASMIATMVYVSVKIGEYKSKVDGVTEVKQSVRSLHERFDSFWQHMAGFERRLGSNEGELKRINGYGKGGH